MQEASQFCIFERSRELSAGIPGLKLRTASGGFGGGAQTIQILVKGTDRDELTRIAQQVEASVSTVPGLTDVTNSGVAGQPEVVVDVDRARASDLGLTAAEVAAALRTSVEGSVATKFRPPSGDDVDVRVRLNRGSLKTVEQIGNIPIVWTVIFVIFVKWATSERDDGPGADARAVAGVGSAVAAKPEH